MKMEDAWNLISSNGDGSAPNLNGNNNMPSGASSSGLSSILSFLNGSGVGSGLFGLLGGLLGSALQFTANKALMKYQADMNEKIWQQTNEYNSPAKQMERMAQAGINPNLAFGDAGNASPSLISQSAGQIGNPAAAISSSVMAVRNLGLMDAQEDLMRAQAEELRSRVPGNNAKPNLMAAQIDHYQSLIGRNIVLNAKDEELIKNLAIERDKISQEVSNLFKEGEILDERLMQERIKSLFAAEHEQAIISELQSRAHLNEADAKLAYEQARDIVLTRASRIAQMVADTENTEQRTELIKGQLDAMQSDIAQGLCAKKHIVYDEDGNRDVTNAYYRINAIRTIGDVAFGWLGSIFNVNVSRTLSKFSGRTYNESHSVGTTVEYDHPNIQDIGSGYQGSGRVRVHR